MAEPSVPKWTACHWLRDSHVQAVPFGRFWPGTRSPTAFCSGVHLLATCTVHDLPAESPIASELSGGLGPYLRRSSKYSLFLELVEKLDVFNTDLQVGWYKVGVVASLLAGLASSALKAIDNNNMCLCGFLCLIMTYGLSI